MIMCCVIKMVGGRRMKIILFYATKNPEAIKLIQHFNDKIKEKGHEVTLIEANKYMQLNASIDLSEPDTMYGFGISGLDEASKREILCLAKMLKNRYVNKPAFIYSGTHKDFHKTKRQLHKILKDKNFDVVISQVKTYNLVEMEKVIERLHDVYRKYYLSKSRQREKSILSCDICEVCTEKTE